ncbi:hypothetical protein GCM10010326_71310 [Streptomyces xanthochromogenes]|uniref:Uncharacterized protein n=1 Tax=Streptomyces xanthochromogenes TaxID=67384 RepID=A0ABQ3ATV0_9ACTN|nr:hypothetical protein GCM10010326_71310 [Streptomyces xanthochromogenes]
MPAEPAALVTFVPYDVTLLLTSSIAIPTSEVTDSTPDGETSHPVMPNPVPASP